MMRKNRQAGAAMLLAVGLFVVAFAQAESAEKTTAASHVMLTPDAVKWGDCPPAVPPGAKCAVIEGDLSAANQLFAFRVWMPDNYKIPPHFHPGDEHLVVLSGTFNMGLGDKVDTSASHPLSAGSFAVMPKGQHHFGWSKGETVIQVYAIGPWGLTYVNPADDPRNMSRTE